MDTNELIQTASPIGTTLDRRELLRVGGIAGVGLLGSALLVGCGGSGNSAVSKATSNTNSGDQAILGAAKIAEALATATYTALINSALFASFSTTDQNYFSAARDEEMYHYNLLKSVTGNTDAQFTYYLPTGMFTNPQVTFNTLVTLEEAFIAAYLVGVAQLSTVSLRTIAAQIMGVESDHRTLARLTANDQNLPTVTGLDGIASNTLYPNNSVFERTFGLTGIAGAVAVLTPFLSQSTANSVAVTFNPAYVPNDLTSVLVGTTP